MESGELTSAGDRWLVSFSAGEQSCALPLTAVERAVPMVEVVPVHPVAPVVIGLINFHGRAVPVFDLPRSLGRADVRYDSTAFLLIGRTARRPFAVAATTVEGVLRVPEEAVVSMGELLPGAGILPGVLTGDRSLVFIHDPETFLTLDQDRELAAALEAAR